MSKGNTVIEVKVGNKIKTINVEIKDSKLVIMAGIAMFIEFLSTKEPVPNEHVHKRTGPK